MGVHRSTAKPVVHLCLRRYDRNEKLAVFSSDCNSEIASETTVRGPGVVTRSADIIVIGAGAFGAWTALSLVEQNAKVVLVDAYGVGNALASSGGTSRNIRAAYGEHELYTRWSIRAWSLWREREAELGQQLLYPCGSLRMLENHEVAAQRAAFNGFAHPHELLDTAEVSYRWPQVDYRSEHILYEPESGILAAHSALTAVARLFEAKGGCVVQGRVERPTGRTMGAITVCGERMSANRFVFACGPWLCTLFPDLLDGWIKTPRRELFFLGPAAGDDRFDWQRCPNLADPLGWTSSNIGEGVKVAPVIRHIALDPDDGDRMPTAALVDQVRAYVAARLPGLVGRPVVGTYVSQLENTDNDDFIIDRHPRYDNIFIAGGGSGHAYKMGPVIGEHVAQFVLTGKQDPAEALLFGLQAHGPVAPGRGG